MSHITPSRMVLALVAASASFLIVGCSQAGTPSAASTSATGSAASSAPSPVAPSSTTAARTPTSTAAGATGEVTTTVIPPTGTSESTGTDLAGEVYGKIV